jgi:hypothetical protein
MTATGERRKKNRFRATRAFQRVFVLRIQNPWLGPVRLGAQHVLVMNEVLSQIDNFLDRPPRERRPERRILNPPEQLWPRLTGERALNPLGPTGDRRQRDSGSGNGPSLAQHQMRRKVAGPPALAQRRRIRPDGQQGRAQRTAFATREGGHGRESTCQTETGEWVK